MAACRPRPTARPGRPADEASLRTDRRPTRPAPPSASTTSAPPRRDRPLCGANAACRTRSRTSDSASAAGERNASSIRGPSSSRRHQHGDEPAGQRHRRRRLFERKPCPGGPAAALRGIRRHVCRRTPAMKIEGTKARGAEVVTYRYSENREEIGAAIAAERGRADPARGGDRRPGRSGWRSPRSAARRVRCRTMSSAAAAAAG